MRLVVPLLVVLALSGCVGTGPSTDPQCGGAVASPWMEEGAFVKVQVVYDATRSAAVCVQLNDAPILSQRVEPSRMSPHVVDFGSGKFAAQDLRVGAWLTGHDLQASAIFPLTEENYVVVHVDAEGAIRIEKFEEPPVFA